MRKRSYLDDGQVQVMDPAQWQPPAATPYDPSLMMQDPSIDEENLPQPGVQVGPPPQGPGQPAPQVRQADPRQGQSLDWLERLVGQAPVKTQPNWLQRLGAAAVGAGEGWSNAASRTKHPLDIGATVDAIEHPGYKSKFEEWQSRVAPTKEIVDIEGMRAGADLKQREEARKEALEGAQADYYKAHGNYMNGLGRQPNQWRMDPKTGALVNMQTGERKDPAMSPADRFKAAKAIDPSMSDDKAQYYALNGNLQGYGGTLANPPKAGIVLAPGAALVDPDTKQPIYTNPNRPQREVDPVVEELRQQRLGDMKNKDLEGVGSHKDTQEKAIVANRQKEISQMLRQAGVGTEEDLPPAAIAAVNRRYAPMLQNVQNEYTAAARRRGIQPDEYDVDPDTLEYTLRGSKPAGPAPTAQKQAQAGAKPAAPKSVKTWNPKTMKFE